MDHDVMHRDVAGLKKFRERAENAISFIEGLQKGGFKPPAADGAVAALSDDQVAQVRQQFSEIIKPVSDGLDVKLNSFDDRLKTLEQQQNTVGLVAIQDRLKALEGSKAEGESFSVRLTAMLDWFEANQEGLTILLSLDGEPDAPDPAVAPNPATVTANAGAQDGSGAAVPEKATDVAPGAAQGSTAAAPADQTAGTGQA